MFLISKRKSALSTFKFFLKELSIREKPIFQYEFCNGYTLIWSNVKPSDNLTLFKDGFVIGKTDFGQLHSSVPYDKKNQNLSFELHSLLNSSKITFDKNGFVLQPGEQSIVYYSGNDISDYSLLIALLNGLKPSLEGVGMLVATGYFLGNSTLFKEIQRISYLNGITIVDNVVKEYMYSEFTPKKNDDLLMIERYKFITPKNIESAMSMSGGLDSRFVLGILISNGIFPQVYSKDGNERKIVQDICSEIGLDLQIVNFPKMEPYLYTVRTDARIYSFGGQYHRMFKSVMVDELLFSGLSAIPSLKNGYKAVWKDFRTNRKNVLEKIINVSYIHTNDKILGFVLQKDELINYYIGCLNYIERDFGKYLTKISEITRLYNHLNRSLNWVPAHVSDVGYFRYPINILADKKAVEFGIHSTSYSNMYSDRLRGMNKLLMDKWPIDYSDGRAFNEKGFLVKDIHKIYYEFIKRFFVFMKEQKSDRSGGIIQVREKKNSITTAEDFNLYFESDISVLLNRSDVRKNTKRAALTLNDVLLLIEKYNKYVK